MQFVEINIHSRVVHAAPYVAQERSATERELFQLRYMLFRHAAKRLNLGVDDALFGCMLQSGARESRLVSCL